MEKPSFVELNRRFRTLQRQEKAEDAAIDSYTTESVGGFDSLGWEELLTKPRAVILGEAGSGKSWELRERARLLKERGEFAFFIRLDQLVDNQLPDLLDEEDERCYIEWRRGHKHAYFFLDSVDEAKFRRVSDFYSALSKVRVELGVGFILKSHIYLSSRISEWKPLADGFEFQRLFPVFPYEKRKKQNELTETEKSKHSLLVVHLEPLSRKQVETFSLANGVGDVTAFAQAVDKAFAWEFARRPLDVSDLIGFWKRNGRIGSLTELILSDIESKLCPHEGRDEFPLSIEEGREGTKWLAACTAFTRKFSFGVPDDSAASFEALNARACVPPHWRESEIRALLNRPIFDGAIYGQFRFHHRRVGEFLAAKWLEDRMEQGCPHYVLEGLLAETVRGKRVLRRLMQPIAAWLCCGEKSFHQFTRNLVLETNPEIHLLLGDPAALSVDYRRQILVALSDIARTRTRIWFESSSDSLARLATPELSKEIADFILDQSLSVDFRAELLQIVQRGQLSACFGAALRLIESPEEPNELKLYAIRAVGEGDHSTSHAQVFQTVSKMDRVPNRLCSAIIESLFPKSISPTQVGLLLSKTGFVEEFSVDLPHYLKSHFAETLSPLKAAELLEQLVRLAQTEPLFSGHDSENSRLFSAQFYWVGHVIPTVLDVLFQKDVLSSKEIDISARALQLLSHIRKYPHFHRENRDELNLASLRHPNVRRRNLWIAVDEFRCRKRKEPTVSGQLFDYGSVIRFCSQDLGWLSEDFRERQLLEDRIVALHLTLEVWDASGRSLIRLWQLYIWTRADAALADAFRKAPYTGPLFPLKRIWFRHIRYQYSRWWWIDKLNKVSNHWHWGLGQWRLFRNLRSIRSGKPTGWLARLAREADEKNTSQWAPATWKDLERNRGKRIARAAKDGCKAAWRKFTPLLPHEKPQPNETSIRVIVGLAGLRVEFEEDPGSIVKLSKGEAELAARYAMDELNGFPSWFGSLALIHPDAVRSVLTECIESEWKFPPERQDVHQVLADLARGDHTLIRLTENLLFSLISAGDPPNKSILRYAISILTQQPVPSLERLGNLAEKRIESNGEEGMIALWFAIWLQVDAKAALPKLEIILNSSSTADDLVVRICSILSGEEMVSGITIKNPNYLEFSHLRKFIPLVYRHVRYKDDLDRSKGTYSPIARDFAQRFRSVLLNRLEVDEDPFATEVLRELADDRDMLPVRDWILKILDQRLLNNADFAPWAAEDVGEFAKQYEVDPKNDRELFAIARNRLKVLKWDVEKSDNSAREELRKDDKEMVLRRWLQRRLLERSQKRYTIPQEEEIDQQERPDLRLEHPKTGPVSIEVKWAESWTLAELLERLENQLIGQYLRANNSSYGIYFLGFIGKKKSWEDPNYPKQLTADEIVAIVSQRARALMQANPKIMGLEVVSIDFRPPSLDSKLKGIGR